MAGSAEASFRRLLLFPLVVVFISSVFFRHFHERTLLQEERRWAS